MIRKICFSLVIVIGLFMFMTPARAQNIDGWWSGKGTYLQGDFVTGEWTALQARGKKVSYLYVDGKSETGYFLIWDDVSQDYLVEPYNLFIRNNIVVLYVPTLFDPTTDAPATATIVLRAVGSASTVTSMSGYYTLYDMGTTVSPETFVRMGPVLFTRVLVSQVPQLAMNKIPFP